MILPAPPDPVLGARAAALLDSDEVAALLEPGLDVRVLACRPRYARYKRRTSLLLQYDLELDVAPGERLSTLGHAWLYADGRALETWRSRSFSRLVERARRRHPGPPLVRAAFLDSLGVLVEIPPVDSRLPALVRAASGRKLRQLLGADAPQGLRHSRPEIVRHKPGRKALLRYATTRGALYAKVHADHRGGSRAALARAARAAGVPTPEPLAHLAELDAVVYDEAPGIRLADLGGDPSYAGWLGAAAELLAAFHRVAPEAAVAPEATGRRRLPEAARAVEALVPELGRAARTLAGLIVRRLDDLDGPVGLAHGDFYDDQLLVSDEGVVLLDLDEARPAHPLVDVGTFLAHLTARTPDADTLRARFMDACRRAGIDVRGALAFEAAALLALAVGPFRRLEPDWPAGVERLLLLAERRLREHERESSAVPVDHALPQLRKLCDARGAGDAISRALGRPVSVTSVSVVRHRPGRRCTLRYRLSDGSRVVAKTYASRRAGRVYESMRRLEKASAALPRALGWDKRERIVVLDALSGRPALPLVLAGQERIGVEAARLLHAIHSSGAEVPRRHRLEDEIRPLRLRVAEISADAPELADAARRCLALTLAGAERPWRWRLRPVHRDFYEDQLLLSDSGLTVLDLDDAAMSEPAVDVANFTAHLCLLRLRPGVRRAAPACVARAFLRRYRDLDPELDDELVTFLEGTTLLRLAAIHLPRAGVGLAAALVNRSGRLLASTVSSSATATPAG